MEDGIRSLDGADYGIISADCADYESGPTTSCDAFSINFKPTSQIQMSGGIDVGVSTEEDVEVELWKEALLSRNMDLVNCCLQAILGDLHSSERQYIGQLMKKVLKEVEDITVGKEIPAPQSIFTRLESRSAENPVAEKLLETIDKAKPIESELKVPNKKYHSRVPNKRKTGRARHFNSFVCPGCERFVRDKSYCPACYSLVARFDRDVQVGNAPRSCRHLNFKGAPKCRNCRYNKYNQLWRFKNKASMNEETRLKGLTNGDRRCLGCLTPFKEGTKKCISCFNLVRKMAYTKRQGLAVPSCPHYNYSGCPECESCRVNRFLNRKAETPKTAEWDSRLHLCTSTNCVACENFGKSVEKAFGSDSIPQCLHKIREGAPSCLNCRYHLWKERKNQFIDEAPMKSEEKYNYPHQAPVSECIKQELDEDIKPDIKRIKMEMGGPIEFEMA